MRGEYVSEFVDLLNWARNYCIVGPYPCDIIRRLAIGVYQIHQGIDWDRAQAGDESYAAAGIHVSIVCEDLELCIEQEFEWANIYDIPFGYTEGRQGRPLFPINWLYSNGLVYVNRGTTKHFVEKGVVGNVIAWGNDRFTNRLHWDWTSRPPYDIRLYGKQKIEYYLVPFDEFNASNIINTVENITAPTCLIPGEGEKSFYRIDNMDLGITAIYSGDGEIWVRGYKIPSDDKSKYRDFEIFNEPLDKINK